MPAIKDGSGGIQALGRYYLTAICRAYPDFNIRVFVKNDRPEEVLPAEWDSVQFHSAANYPAVLRTLVFALLGIYYALVDKPVLVLSCHLHFLPALQVIRFLTGAHTAVILHGVETWEARGTLRLAALNSTDLAINVSRYTLNHVLRNLDVSPSIAVVIGNTFDATKFHIGHKPQSLLSRYGLTADQPILLTISRLALEERYKGHAQVLRSLIDVRKHYPTIRYVIGGRGDYLAELKRLAESLGVADLTIFAGYIPNEELGAHYQLCDVFVMPSKKEGFGIVFLEAMACGKPVIAGNQDGSVDALDSGRLGVLVDPDDVPKLSQSIVDVLSKQIQPALIFNPEQLRASVIETFGNSSFNRKVKDTLDPFLSAGPDQEDLSLDCSNQPAGSRTDKVSVTVLTHLTSPYQVEYLNAVAENEDCDLKVVYLTSQDQSRLWTHPTINHQCIILSDSPQLRSKALSWLLSSDVAVFNYYTDWFAMWAMYKRIASGRPWVFWGERPGAMQLGLIGTIGRSALLFPLTVSRVPIWGIGEFAVKEYANEFGADRPFTNLPYFSNLKRFQWPDRRRPLDVLRFIYCGSLSKRKGTDLLATAFLRLASQFPQVQLILVGEGPLASEVKDMLRPVSAQVDCVGFVDWNDLPSAYQRGDVFCFPSRYDGWGLALVEAMASGLPVIGTDRTGAALEYVEHGVNGWLIPADDAEALYIAMEEAVSAPIHTMGNAASQAVLRHSLEQGSKRFVESAKSALSENSR
jgi:glycosyltransferase involved in cell wall biosynthesis